MRRLVLFALLVALPGCFYPADRGRALEAKVDRLGADSAQMQTELKEARDQLAATLPKIDEKVAEVTKALDGLDTAARRKDADIGVQLQKTMEDLSQLRGQVETYLHKITELETALGAQDQKLLAMQGTAAVKEAEAKKKAEELQRPTNPKDFLALAQERAKAGEVLVARQLFTELTGHEHLAGLGPLLGEREEVLGVGGTLEFLGLLLGLGLLHGGRALHREQLLVLGTERGLQLGDFVEVGLHLAAQLGQVLHRLLELDADVRVLAARGGVQAIQGLGDLGDLLVDFRQGGGELVARLLQLRLHLRGVGTEPVDLRLEGAAAVSGIEATRERHQQREQDEPSHGAGILRPNRRAVRTSRRAPGAKPARLLRQRLLLGGDRRPAACAQATRSRPGLRKKGTGRALPSSRDTRARRYSAAASRGRRHCSR